MTRFERRSLVMLQEINPTELRVASAEKAAYYLDAAIASRTRPLNNKPEGELCLILQQLQKRWWPL